MSELLDDLITPRLTAPGHQGTSADFYRLASNPVFVNSAAIPSAS